MKSHKIIQKNLIVITSHDLVSAVRTQRSRQFLCTILSVPLHLHGVIRSREPEAVKSGDIKLMVTNLLLFNPELEWQIRHIGFPSFNELEEEESLEHAELDCGFNTGSKV